MVAGSLELALIPFPALGESRRCGVRAPDLRFANSPLSPSGRLGGSASLKSRVLEAK